MEKKSFYKYILLTKKARGRRTERESMTCHNVEREIVRVKRANITDQIFKINSKLDQ